MFQLPFWNSNSDKIKKVGFEDIKHAIDNPSRFILISTLSNDDQDVLIKTTIVSDTEEKVLNELMNDFQKDEPIIVYGKNSCDNSVEKCKQLVSLGFDKVYMYIGGMFEWVLLQDVYGFTEFPTNRKVMDILRYSPVICIR